MAKGSSHLPHPTRPSRSTQCVKHSSNGRFQWGRTLVDLGLVERVGARLHPWLPMDSALQRLASPGNGHGASHILPLWCPCPQGLPSEGSPGGAGATQQAGTGEPTLPSKIQLSPGAGRARQVPVHLATSQLSLWHCAPQPPYINACGRRHRFLKAPQSSRASSSDLD